MKPFILSLVVNLLSLLLLLSIVSTYQTPWPFSLLLLFISSFSLVPFFLNLWLVPGGFAWRNYHFNSPKFVGPIGWPLLGTLPHMGSLAHRKLATMASSLGATRLMALSLGATRVIITSHPDTAKEILSGSSFSDRPVKESARLLMFERAIGFAPSGDYWRHLRRIAANCMFSPRRISSLEGLRQHVADEMVVGVWREMEERGVVEVREILQNGSLRNIVESVFGSSLGQEGEELGLMVKEGYELIAKFNLADYFSLGFLDFHGVKRRCLKLATKVNGLVGHIIEKRKEDGQFSGRNDFLSVLLSLPKEDQLSHVDMVAILWVRTLSLSLAYKLCFQPDKI